MSISRSSKGYDPRANTNTSDDIFYCRVYRKSCTCDPVFFTSVTDLYQFAVIEGSEKWNCRVYNPNLSEVLIHRILPGKAWFSQIKLFINSAIISPNYNKQRSFKNFVTIDSSWNSSYRILLNITFLILSVQYPTSFYVILMYSSIMYLCRIYFPEKSVSRRNSFHTRYVNTTIVFFFV